MPDTPHASTQRKHLSNLAVRLLFAVFAVPVLLYLLFIAPKWGFFSILGLACFISSIELFSMVMPGRSLKLVFGVIATLSLFSIFVFFRSIDLLSGAIVLIILGSLISGMTSSISLEKAVFSVGWLVAGPLYLASMLGCLGLLFSLEHGGSWVFLAAVISWLGDTGAYFVGRAFGSHKLCPSISPKKSVEGALFGLFSSVLGAIAVRFWLLPSLPLIEVVVLSIVAGIFGQLGDLSESLIKRSSGVKDAGWIIPGHGGLLDRIDSLLFVSAILWLYVAVLVTVQGGTAV